MNDNFHNPIMMKGETVGYFSYLKNGLEIVQFKNHIFISFHIKHQFTLYDTWFLHIIPKKEKKKKTRIKLT